MSDHPAFLRLEFYRKLRRPTAHALQL